MTTITRSETSRLKENNNNLASYGLQSGCEYMVTRNPYSTYVVTSLSLFNVPMTKTCHWSACYFAVSYLASLICILAVVFSVAFVSVYYLNHTKYIRQNLSCQKRDNNRSKHLSVCLSIYRNYVILDASMKYFMNRNGCHKSQSVNSIQDNDVDVLCLLCQTSNRQTSS